MAAALAALNDAESQLEQAVPNKKGHRVKAMRMVDAAISDVQAGEQYAAAHPEEVMETDDAPVVANDEGIPGAVSEPHMAEAFADLQTARAELRAAAPNKGGFRVRAIGEVNQAIQQIKKGIASSRWEE
jgi:hypothetical protein